MGLQTGILVSPLGVLPLHLYLLNDLEAALPFVLPQVSEEGFAHRTGLDEQDVHWSYSRSVNSSEFSQTERLNLVMHFRF